MFLDMVALFLNLLLSFGIFSACIIQAQYASAQEMFTELNNVLKHIFLDKIIDFLSIAHPNNFQE